LRRGAILGIVGPNGCGKTTLIRAITNAIPADNGSILYEGRPVCDIGRKEFAMKVSVLLQSRESYLPEMTVEEVVCLGRIPHLKTLQFMLGADDWEAVRDAMRTAKVSDLRDRMVNELSGGERQRVLLARALAQTPELLILDEPTSHLDIGFAVDMLKIARRYVNENSLTVMAVMHDLNLASVYCDRLILMKDGAIVRDGGPAEVLKEETIRSCYHADIKIYSGQLSRNPQILF
jgi:iron complex transport system ATP-binding protein